MDHNDHDHTESDHTSAGANVCTTCDHEHKDEGGTCACGCGK